MDQKDVTPIARPLEGTATYIRDPYTNKPVLVYGKPANSLLRSG
ncbi:hypothetical protein [Rubritalea tangerina]